MSGTLISAEPRQSGFPPLAVPGLLVAILLLQGAVSLSLRNTAFQDEALYLYAGRQIFNALIGGAPVADPYGQYFSGLPYLYPVIASVFDTIGGLELARAFSLACALLTTSAVYFVTANLIDRNSAFFAAGLYAFQGSVLFIGRLATHDGMSLALLALATSLAVYPKRKHWLLAALLLGLILLLAVATKYAALLFVPVVLAVMVLQSWNVVSVWQALLRGIVPLIVMVAAAIFFLMLSGRAPDVLVGLRTTTLERVPIVPMDRFVLASKVVTEGGSFVALGLLGLFMGMRRRRFLGLLFIGAAFFAPTYHVYKSEFVSMHKHIAYGLFFAAPLAGLATARISGYERGGKTIAPRWVAGGAICVLMFLVGFRQAQDFYSEWPNSDQFIRVLRSHVPSDGGRILAEEAEVPRYYLKDIVAYWQWNHLYWFEYTNKSGRPLLGEEAYKAAIQEGYFELVLLRYGHGAPTAYAITDVLKNEGRYEQIARIPFSTTFQEGAYWIWRRR